MRSHTVTGEQQNPETCPGMESLLYACGVMGGMLLWKLYFSFIRCTGTFYVLVTRAVDLHSFLADSDPAAFLNADPDPASFSVRIRIQLKKLI